MDSRSAKIAHRRRQTHRSSSGRYIRSVRWLDATGPTSVAWDATLRMAAMRAGREGLRGLRPEDLRAKIRSRSRGKLIVLVVDASESMEADSRMAAAKGAALGLVFRARRRRDRVAAVVFGGESAEVLLPPTTSVVRARERLRALPLGGATPFAHGLKEAWQLVRSERVKDPDIEPLIVVLSDGKANVPLVRGETVLKDLCAVARAIRADGIRALVIDTNPSYARSERVARVAEALGARVHSISRLGAARLLRTIRAERFPRGWDHTDR